MARCTMMVCSWIRIGRRTWNVSFLVMLGVFAIHDRNRLFAQPGSKEFDPPAVTASDPTAGNHWAVLIGADRYREQSSRLNFCVNDMMLLGNALISRKQYDEDHIWLLSNDSDDFDNDLSTRLKLPTNRDRKAELGDIRATLTEVVAKCEPNDSLLIAFSGHGAIDDQENAT